MTTPRRLLPAWMPALFLLASVCTAQDRQEEHTYGIELSGELCGYADVRVSRVADGDRPYLLIEQRNVVSVVALGMNVDQQIELTIHVDPRTGQYTYFAMHVRTGEVELESKVVVDGDTARYTSLTSTEERTVTLPPDVVLANTLYLYEPKRDLADGGLDEMSYTVFDAENPATPFQTTTYSKVRTDVLETAVGTFEVLVVDAVNEFTGAKSRIWLKLDDAMVVKVTQPNGTEIYLADASVKERVMRVDVDDTIITKANSDITDIHGISYMEVKATIEPTGARFDSAKLNVPGQRFEGTVEDNRIEGVFVIEHVRYDGADAPPYPPSFGGDESLTQFLGAGGLIQSDDPVLAEKAREIAEGSADSWEAATRLSRWVADNIGYEIPGGVFARKVYDMRVGECGGHSILLAAFCRAVGIPARGVWGCMYAPIGGGSFGQHAWTEIYMGEAGWIPVDSTAHEVDFVDSGHIRIGVFGSTEDGGAIHIALGAKSMEVLDYRVDSGAGGEVEASAAGKYVAYVGGYEAPDVGQPFEVIVKNGRLAVEIPGQVVLPMNDPDDEGNWICSLTSLVYCSFPRDGSGNVKSMEFHEIVRMRRKSDPAEIAEDVPDELRRYLGGYFLAQANAEFEIIWDEGKLGLLHPIEGTIRHLAPSVEQGRWTIEEGMKEITFLENDDGEVITLSVDVRLSCPRAPAETPLAAHRAPQDPRTAAVSAALDDLHRAMASADADAYFARLAPECVVIGTDSSERWTVDELRVFLAPYFDREGGRQREMRDRHIDFCPGDEIAYFDELLEVDTLGECRGTGVMVKREGDWLVVQYSLSFPVPNEIVFDVVDMIGAFRDDRAASATGDQGLVRAALSEYIATATAAADGEPIDGELFATDIVAEWSNGETYRGREAVVEVIEQSRIELEEGFESFEAGAEDVRIDLRGDVAWVECRIELAGVLLGDGRTFERTVRSSFRFEKRDGRWQMAHEKSSRVGEDRVAGAGRPAAGRR